MIAAQVHSHLDPTAPPAPETPDDCPDESAHTPPPQTPLVLRIRTFGLDPDFHVNYAGARAILGRRSNRILRRRSNTQLIRSAIATAYPVIMAAAEQDFDDLRAALLQQQMIQLELSDRLRLMPRIDFMTDDPLAGFTRSQEEADRARLRDLIVRHGPVIEQTIKAAADGQRDPAVLDALLAPAFTNPTIAKSKP